MPTIHETIEQRQTLGLLPKVEAAGFSSDEQRKAVFAKTTVGHQNAADYHSEEADYHNKMSTQLKKSSPKLSAQHSEAAGLHEKASGLHEDAISSGEHSEARAASKSAFSASDKLKVGAPKLKASIQAGGPGSGRHKGYDSATALRKDIKLKPNGRHYSVSHNGQEIGTLKRGLFKQEGFTFHHIPTQTVHKQPQFLSRTLNVARDTIAKVHHAHLGGITK